MPLYVDVILPLPLQNLFTYSVPDDVEYTPTIGSRVIIQFGRKKFYTAIVFRIYEAEEKSGIKEIATTLEDYPIVTEKQLSLWQWITSYYMCSLGDVYKAALPSALKPESETYVIKNPEFEAENPLTAAELKIFNSLSSDKAMKISEIEHITNIRNAISPIKSLVEKGASFLSESIGKRYTPKTMPTVELCQNFSEDELNTVLDQLQKQKKQQSLLLTFLDLKGKQKVVFKKQLLDASTVTQAVLSSLVKKNILQTVDFEIDRINYGETNTAAAYELNSYQKQAYKEIEESFQQKDVTLLHGVTSSGKTEIYIQLIKETIANGGQVLYLLPEIALTTQITERLKTVFGNKLAVYHSKFNDNERAETWNKLLQNKDCQIILGARSSIFLPFTKLQLVIVDEEHESSYKQQDPAPRYNAKNLALVLADLFKAKTLLGTATPSIETYHSALAGRYGLVTLDKRHANIELPKIRTIDTKELRRKKLMKSFLSPPLVEEMTTALEKKEQIILFQNRRGFASMLECKTCSWTLRCSHCDVSLTYHKGQYLMICHYCGTTYKVPAECPRCETPTLDALGYGTERVEEEVATILPEADIARMDLDTTRGKLAYERIISDFEQNKTNVLIGTQMVSKGLDFDNVSIVGILNADNLLNHPDFRAHERAYQLITQVSGRAGRKNKQGTVILQTANPTHPIISLVEKNDYESFFNLQLHERKLFNYPPFFRLISIVLKAKDERMLDKASMQFALALKQSFDKRVLGPTKPPVAWVQTLHIRKILLKIENQASPLKIREIILKHQAEVLSNTEFKSLLLHYDVDPM